LSSQVEAVGLSVPGIYRSEDGTAWVPNIDGWEAYPIRDRIREAVGDRTLQVRIDNDRACYILGELWRGDAQGCTDAIYLAVGTGIGAGILTGGQILRGTGDVAGSIGWMALSTLYKREYSPCGDFEYHASGAGIAQMMRKRLSNTPRPETPLAQLPFEELTAGALFEAEEMGDPVATDWMREIIRYWGAATANLISIFNPEKVIFGGGVFGSATRYMSRIRGQASLWSQPVSFSQVQIVASRLGGEAGILGAGKLALDAVEHEDLEMDE
ncbi:MAG: ROK family protein, partial [Bacteroidota bacterium]